MKKEDKQDEVPDLLGSDWGKPSAEEARLLKKAPSGDRRLVKIVNWLNKTTPNERKWIAVIRDLYIATFINPIYALAETKTDFLAHLDNVNYTSNPADFLNRFTPKYTELPEDHNYEWDRVADKIFNYIDEYGSPRSPLPPLSEKAALKLTNILPVYCELWDETEYWRVSKRRRNRPPIKTCPVCGTYFVVTTKNQKYCQTKKPRCLRVVIESKPEYKKRKREYTQKWRKDKSKERVSAEPIQTLAHARTAAAMAPEDGILSRLPVKV